MLALALQEQLALHGITQLDEVSLREALEERVTTYTLIKLAPWPARRWKCHYRLMMASAMYDAQSVPEAYALALLAAFSQPEVVDPPATSEPALSDSTVDPQA